MSVYKGENVIAGGSVDTYFVRKPAWSQAETIATLPFTAPKDGILLLQVGANTGHGSRTFSINGVLVASVSFSADAQMATCTIQVNAGDVLTSNAGIWGTYKFVPFEDSTIAEPEVVTPEYIRNQNILSDWEDITVPAAGFTAPYDGFVSISNSVATGKTGLAAILVNGVSCNSWRILPTDTTVGANTLACSAPIKKGDVVTVIGVDIGATKARYYKLRDYRGR